LRKVWAYVFVTTGEPRKVVQTIRRAQGVVNAGRTVRTPDVIALVEEPDITIIDAVTCKIALAPKGIKGLIQKVARWIQ